MERRADSIVIGAGDWFRTQLTDNMSLFMQQNVYPFVVLNGSVCRLKIIDDPEPLASVYHPITVHRPLITIRPEDFPTAVKRTTAEVTVSTSATAPPDPLVCLQFVVPDFAAENMILSNQKRTVTREDNSGARVVMLNRPLEIEHSLVLLIEKSENLNQIAWSMKLGLTGCDLTSPEKIERHGSVNCETADCGRVCITRTISNVAGRGSLVHIKRNSVNFSVRIDTGVQEYETLFDIGALPNSRFIFPYFTLSGTAASITIIDPSDSSPSTSAPNGHQPQLVAHAGDHLFAVPYNSRQVRPPADVLAPNPRSTLFPSSPDSPPQSMASASSAALELKLQQLLNNAEAADSLASYEMFESVQDRNSPRVWDDCSLSSRSDVHSSITQPHIEPIARPVRHPPGFEQQVRSSSSQRLIAMVPKTVKKMDANRTASLFLARKWYKNGYVLYANHVISRIRSPQGPNYIFSSKMRVNEKICFKVTETEEMLGDGSLIFGLTTLPILTFEPSALPPNPNDLAMRNDSSGWFISYNLYNSIGVCDGLTVTRTETGISLSLDADDDAVEIMSGVDCESVVYPFFHLSGCVKSLQLSSPVEPLSMRDRVRLYLIFFYLMFLNNYALSD